MNACATHGGHCPQIAHQARDIGEIFFQLIALLTLWETTGADRVLRQNYLIICISHCQSYIHVQSLHFPRGAPTCDGN
jgi:hypothetical protein